MSLSIVGLGVQAPALANTAGTGLVISEAYVNGGSSGASYLNKFVELFNPTSSAIALTGDTLQYRAPTSTVTPSGSQVFALSGTVAAHAHFLIQLPSNGANGDALPTPDLSTGGSINPGAGGGTLYVASSTTGVLPTDAAVIDRIGWGTSNAPEGTAPTGNSVTLSYQRAASGADTDNNAADFQVAAPTPQNSGGSSTPGGVAVTNPGTQTSVSGTAISPLTLAATGGTQPYAWTSTGLPSGLTLSGDGVVTGTPQAAGGSTVTVTATDATGATGSATFTWTVTAPAQQLTIAQIQGTNTDTSPYAGQNVTTDGVVTAVYATGGFNGFFLETGGAGGTPEQDKTPGASDAIFVFGSISAGQVSVGESVRVTGAVSEYQGETEISSPAVTKIADLPAVKPDVIPWTGLDTDAEKEAHEGELVTPQGTFTVSDNYDANYYGSFTLAAGDKPLRQPTDAGKAGSAQALATTADNAARMVTLDDGSSLNYSSSANSGTPLPWLTPGNPVSVGSAVTFHQPVILEYRFSLWNFQPTAQVTDDGHAVATFGDTRTGNAKPAAVGGGATLATFNVENYFPMTGEQYVAQGLGTCTYYNDRAGNHIGDNTCVGKNGTDPGPRGAATAASFARQQQKTVTGINRLGAGVVSLEEIENSAWFGEPRDTALSGLVDALNAAAGSKVWAYVPSPDASELPPLAEQDVIRTAFIYKPAQVTPVGAAAVLADQSGDGQPFSIAREPLAQGFKKVGASDTDAFLVVANHWKSKGSGTPLYPGDTEDTSSPAVDQGAFNATRVHEAQAVNTWASQVATGLGTDKIFLVGDFNSYTHEDPMEVLYAAGYTDMGSTLDPSEQTYSYNSLEGSLDHVLANPAARKLVTGADVWQINAQEAVAYAYSRYNYNASILFDGTDPFAASDHDPVIAGLDLPSTPAWSPTKIYLGGELVAYKGSQWRALWWTTLVAPGQPYGAWEEIKTAPDGTAIWTESRIFTAGDTVLYNGQKYVAQWWTRDQAPTNQPYGPWKLAS